MLLFTLHTYV